jgi:uncharacterized phage-associated protein
MPPMVSAHDVARVLRSQLATLGSVKLHKLLYYVQGWHLAVMGAALFTENIEAWVNGPVVAELWADEKHGRALPAERELSVTQRSAVDYVVRRYGHFTGLELVKRTHREDPWRLVSESDDDWMPSSPTISHDALRTWFERDEDYVSYREEVERLRTRTDVYSFRVVDLPDDLEEVVVR